jgi:hypothetical protein
MKTASRRIAVTLALLALMAAGVNFAKAQKAGKPNSQPVEGRATEAPRDMEQLQATADRAADRIQASPSEKRELVEVVRTRNVDRATLILRKAGFTSKQLEEAKIEFSDNTGGGSGGGTLEKVKVTIRVSCCPMSITITISF